MSAEGRIGLFGGSFDPVHMGHLILAERALDFIGLERVYFIPTAVPPHKSACGLTDFKIRRRMVELAIDGNGLFEISLVECKKDVSYTYESILHFKTKGYGKDQIHLLLGSDSLEEIGDWMDPEVIFSNATIVVFSRPGRETLPPLPRETAAIVIETGSNTISSSDIRRLVREGRSIRYLVPAPVERYIIEHSLYGGTT